MGTRTDAYVKYGKNIERRGPLARDEGPTRAYKLFRKMNDGTLSPLFINKTQRIPVGQWLPAEDHPTKGFAHRPGWHATLKPEAPHLTTTPKAARPRVWCEVEVKGFCTYNRPESQGGTWVLANQLRVIREVTHE